MRSLLTLSLWTMRRGRRASARMTRRADGQTAGVVVVAAAGVAAAVGAPEPPALPVIGPCASSPWPCHGLFGLRAVLGVPLAAPAYTDLYCCSAI